MEKFLDSYKKYWANWKDFSGKTTKADFWQAVLVMMIISVIANLIGRIPVLGPIVSLAYAVITIVPSLAIWWRRMHDAGHEGWWSLIPVVNIVYALQDSKTDANLPAQQQ